MLATVFLLNSFIRLSLSLSACPSPLLAHNHSFSLLSFSFILFSFPSIHSTQTRVKAAARASFIEGLGLQKEGLSSSHVEPKNIKVQQKGKIYWNRNEIFHFQRNKIIFRVISRRRAFETREIFRAKLKFFHDMNGVELDAKVGIN